jgi:hypothetical protein
VNQEKLDALYARATDERTPEEERRTSAVIYLKHAPRIESKPRDPTTEELRKCITKEMFTTLFAPEIAVHKRAVEEQKTRVDSEKVRADKAEKELRELKEAIRAAQAASEKVAKLIDEPQKAEPRDKTRPDFASQIGDMFNNQQGPYRYKPGGFSW